MSADASTADLATLAAAIVGYGLSGRVFHGPFLKADPDFRVASVVTGDPGRQEKAAADHASAHIHSTFDELMADDAPLDLVVLSSPPDTHVEFARRAFERGAAVVVDKPFVATAADAEILTALASKAGRPLMVFHNRRWDGDFLTLRRILDQGLLGDVFAFESSFEHWAPTATRGWKDQLPRSSAGGVAYDLGSHLVDQALVLFGPATVGEASLRCVRNGGGNDDHSRIVLRHDSGVESSLLMSRVSRALGPRFRVLGTRGSYTSSGLDGQESALAAGMRPDDDRYGVTAPEHWGVVEVDGPDGITRQPVPAERGDYPAFYRAAARAVRGYGQAPVPLDDAVQVVRILEDASERSARQHGPS